MQNRLVTSIGIGLLAIGMSGPLLAASTNKEMEQRISRLERMVNSQGLVDIMLRLENLQNEVQMLRGETEVLSHRLEEVKNRQRDLYLDLDRRLLQLERATAGTGGAAAGAVAGGATAGAEVTPATKPAPAKPPVTTTAKQGEQQAYQKAFDELRNLHYEKASLAFRDFLNKYPDGRYAQIAQYWLAETNYAQRKFKQAIGDYQTLIDKYPSSPKLAEAMLKIGYSQYELKNYPAAEKILRQLLKRYPGTTEAGQAGNLLQKIRLKRGK